MRKKLNIFVASLIFAILLWGSISLSDIYYTNISVKLRLTDFPKGYITGSPIPDEIKLRVRGQGWRLVSRNVGPETEFRVTVEHDSGWHHVNLSDYLEINRWLFADLNIISLSPDSINFFVERTISKKLPISSGLELEFKPGFGLASNIEFEPDSVLVRGPISYLQNLKDIKTNSKELGILDSKTEAEVSLVIPRGFGLNSEFTEATLDVQRIVDQQFDNIPVEIKDISSGKDVVLLPNRVSMNLRGGIEILGKLQENKIQVFVRYPSLVDDTTGSIIPEVILPKNVTLLYLKPERLRYIIRFY